MAPTLTRDINDLVSLTDQFASVVEDGKQLVGLYVALVEAKLHDGAKAIKRGVAALAFAGALGAFAVAVLIYALCGLAAARTPTGHEQALVALYSAIAMGIVGLISALLARRAFGQVTRAAHLKTSPKAEGEAWPTIA